MKYIDISYEISEKTQMYPGLFKPHIYQEKEIENDGVNIKKLNMITHTGTHIDAPRHFYQQGITIDKLPIDKFIGEAVYLDLSKTKLGTTITMKDIMVYENIIHVNDIVILNTGIFKKYLQEAFNTKYPTISADVANWFVKKEISTFATDATSVDKDGESLIHKILLGANIPIIENLTNLDNIISERIRLIAMPLKIKNGDGSPCRAIALLD